MTATNFARAWWPKVGTWSARIDEDAVGTMMTDVDIILLGRLCDRWIIRSVVRWR